MPTQRDIITQAMKMAGVLGLGQTLNAEDINDGSTALQNMVTQWQVKRWLVPSLYDIAMPGNNEASNRIGAGQYWNTLRPDKIMAAYFIQPNSGSTPVSFPLYPMYSYEDYSRISLKTLNSWPTRYFYDNAFPYGNVFIWPIPTADYEIHLILKSPLGFSTTISTVAVATGGEGGGYTDGTYAAVPLVNLNEDQFASAIGSFIIGISAIGGTSLTGMSATANVVIMSGVITGIEIQSGGELYKVGDVFTLDETIVGAGTGFVGIVTAVESSLDSEMSFPPEYQRALIYNLAVELGSMYQMEPLAITQKIARTSLKTLIAANTQIPVLRMPGTLPGRRRAGIVNANGGCVWADVY
jgi:hypothetical protein